MEKIIEDIWLQLGGVGLFAISGWITVWVLFKQYVTILEKYQTVLKDSLEVQSSLQNQLKNFTNDIKHSNDTICELSATMTDNMVDTQSSLRQTLELLSDIKEQGIKESVELAEINREIEKLLPTTTPQIDEILEAIQLALSTLSKK